MNYSHAKVQGQRSVGYEEWKQTEKRTEVIALPPSLMRSAIIRRFNIYNNGFVRLQYTVEHVPVPMLTSSLSVDFGGFGELGEKS